MPSDAVRVFVPGSIGNVGPGLDILGLALDGPGDSVEIEWADQPGIEVTDPGHPTLPRESDRNTASLAAAAVFRIAGTTRGTRLKVIKGLPLSAGQGGSAASAVASASTDDRS